MAERQDQRQVVTLLSCNYSGSHFLSLMLGSHSRAQHIGEVRSLRRTYQRQRVPCWLCDDHTQCPVMRGIDASTMGRVYDIIFDNFNDPSLTTLVDASKKVQWAEQFVGRTPFRMKYIHLIRDPRALVRRWSLFYQGSLRQRWHERSKAARRRPRMALPLLVGPQWKVYLYRWLNENEEIIRFIHRHRADCLLVTYREAALEPERTVQRIMDWLGLNFEPQQLDYWTFPHHGSQKPEYQWVKDNPGRFFDQRWREFLSPDVQAQIAQTPDVQRLLQSLDLTLNEDGLRRLNDPSPTGSAADAPLPAARGE